MKGTEVRPDTEEERKQEEEDQEDENVKDNKYKDASDSESEDMCIIKVLGTTAKYRY